MNLNTELQDLLNIFRRKTERERERGGEVEVERVADLVA